MGNAVGDVWTVKGEGRESARVFAWDADVPCDVAIIWDEPTNAARTEKAVELAKEVMLRLTPESIARPRAELVVAAVDDTGEKARRELARWEGRRGAVASLMTLAPGYPRIARGEEFPDGPPGKHFLLFGVCPSQQGQNMASVLQGVYPPHGDINVGVGATHFNVDGQGLPNDCPDQVSAKVRHGIQYGGYWWDEGQGRVISLAVVEDPNPVPGQTHVRVAAFLMSPERDVLDFTTASLPKPVDGMEKGRYLASTTKQYTKCRAGSDTSGPLARYGYVCEVLWGDYPCLGRKETESVRLEFRAKNDKLEVTTVKSTSPGTQCQAPE